MLSEVEPPLEVEPSMELKADAKGLSIAKVTRRQKTILKSTTFFFAIWPFLEMAYFGSIFFRSASATPLSYNFFFGDSHLKISTRPPPVFCEKKGVAEAGQKGSISFGFG